MKKILLTTTAFTLFNVSLLQAQDYPRQVFWGDTHLHTSNSFDVYLFDTPGATLDTAYRFAKGLPVVSPVTGTTWQLETPLDFVIVADHAESLGTINRLFEGDPEIAQTKTGRAFLEIAPEQTAEQLLDIYSQLTLVGTGAPADVDLTLQDLAQDTHGREKRRTSWEVNNETADAYNEPGVFTAFIGWEWTSLPNASNLHRVVFTPQDSEAGNQFLPFSSMESEDPEDLWAWLEKTSSQTGAEFQAIPHNPNISKGLMFPIETMSGGPIDAEYADTRTRWEHVVEVTQIKGDSEAHPLLSPTDEFADFKTFDFTLSALGEQPDPTEGDYARSGLKRGLEIEAQAGANPYKFGMVGSTDSHTGMPAVEENNFAGKGKKDSLPSKRSKPTGLGASKGWDMGASGYAGVWATENTRQAIFDAFERREVYATTGPRMTVRFFGGHDFVPEDANGDIAAAGYAKGVPMGGDLTDGDGTPSFLIAAMKDPNEANLDRVQVVKGWLDANGNAQEKIFDVALSDGRTDGSVPVGNTVDLETGAYSNDIGETTLTTVWEDPEFDPTQSAFYYVRVLQIPTPRYSLLDAIALDIDVEETGRPATIQERAYTSPIWYTPQS